MQYVKVLVIIFSALLLGACELVPKVFTPVEQHKAGTESVEEASNDLCINDEQRDIYQKWCDLNYMLEFAIASNKLTWPERKERIAMLGDDTHLLIEKLLLTQGTSTPYRDRLRAQNWILKASGNASTAMSTLLNALIYENSKQLLEFESAITILSSVNARQEKVITELQSQLDEKEEQIELQRNQVEQLLKIESDLIEQNRNEKR